MAELKTLCIDNTCLNTPTAIDYITEQGEEGKWKYRKWASGKIEQFYHESANIVFDKTFSTFDYWERTPLSPPPQCLAWILDFAQLTLTTGVRGQAF